LTFDTNAMPKAAPLVAFSFAARKPGASHSSFSAGAARLRQQAKRFRRMAARMTPEDSTSTTFHRRLGTSETVSKRY
jgi:hypothetical protein